jgi:hypothetical protein
MEEQWHRGGEAWGPQTFLELCTCHVVRIPMLAKRENPGAVEYGDESSEVLAMVCLFVWHGYDVVGRNEVGGPRCYPCMLYPSAQRQALSECQVLGAAGITVER